MTTVLEFASLRSERKKTDRKKERNKLRNKETKKEGRKKRKKERKKENMYRYKEVLQISAEIIHCFSNTSLDGEPAVHT